MGCVPALVWVRSDAATLRQRLADRGLARDAEKLAQFAAFAGSMRLGSAPAVPHVAIDNRLSAAEPLTAQIEAALGPWPEDAGA